MNITPILDSLGTNILMKYNQTNKTLSFTDTCSQCRSLNPGLQIICNSGMWTLNLSTLLLTLSATLRGPGASLNVLVSFNTVLYMLPISSSTSSELMSVNGPFKAGKRKTVYAFTVCVSKVNFVTLKNLLNFKRNDCTPFIPILVYIKPFANIASIVCISLW